jgi:hypothetical protein
MQPLMVLGDGMVAATNTGKAASMAAAAAMTASERTRRFTEPVSRNGGHLVAIAGVPPARYGSAGANSRPEGPARLEDE